MTEVALKKVKCESLGGYVVLSSPYMDDEEDFLTWTNDLTYPADDFTDAAVNPPQPNNVTDPNNISGRKRLLWDIEGPNAKRITVRNTDNNGLHKPGPPDKSNPQHIAEESGESNHLPIWQNDSVETVSTPFDGSLSGLGGAAFAMNDGLLSSPSLTVFKQENGNTDGVQLSNDADNGCLQRLLQGNNFSPRSEHDCRFQYVLAAATSIASKQGEETLTYLNQGQSYGIKLKKVGELIGFKGKLLKSVIRLQFHERRLQYSEKEQILAWQASRPGERIVELDVPLSYGLFDVEHDTTMVNTLSFRWDPTQEVGAYIKVNSISTEFTPKKHGGEKGVPFRIQVETFIEGDACRLHAAACQIRVFKLKGADRKHKQEREKWQKLTEGERAKYQPPYESTVLSDLAPDAVFTPQPFVNNGDPGPFRSYPSPRQANNVPTGQRGSRPQGLLPVVPDNQDAVAKLEEAAVPAIAPVAVPAAVVDGSAIQVTQFSVDMGREQVGAWMLRNGFEMLANTFVHFIGTDMMRLTRQDLVTMCGLPHGTRLFYALRSKAAIRLTLYVSTPGKSWFHAIYLQSTSVVDFAAKLTALLSVGQVGISDMYLAGPNGIHVLITDEVLGNVVNESSYTLQIVKDENADRCCLLLNPTSV